MMLAIGLFDLLSVQDHSTFTGSAIPELDISAIILSVHTLKLYFTHGGYYHEAKLLSNNQGFHGVHENSGHQKFRQEHAVMFLRTNYQGCEGGVLNQFPKAQRQKYPLVMA